MMTSSFLFIPRVRRGQRNVRYKMTSVCGHVNSLDFPAKYNNWDRVDPAELFFCPTETKVTQVKFCSDLFFLSPHLLLTYPLTLPLFRG